MHVTAFGVVDHLARSESAYHKNESWQKHRHAVREVRMASLSATLPTLSPSTATFHQILIATDFSEPAHRALSNAILLATEHDANLTVVHVLQHPNGEKAAEDHLRSLAGELGPRRPVRTLVVRHTSIAQAITGVIQDAGSDLLVIGTRGRGPVGMLAVGSVAEELLRSACCPVMTIGPKADIAAKRNGPGFHSILFATDFGPGSTKALPVTLALARHHAAKLLMLHMLAPMPATSASLSAYSPATAAADELRDWESSTRERAVRQLKACLPAESGLAVQPDFVVGTDFLAEGILTAVEKYRVDLIVMGANHAASPRTAAHIPWTAIHEVLRDAPCPVLTVAG